MRSRGHPPRLRHAIRTVGRAELIADAPSRGAALRIAPPRPNTGRYPTVAVTMSVNRFPVPIAKSGRKMLPVLVRPSYSPTK
jgi:hypothetical protein